MKPLKDIYTNKDIFRQLAADMKKAYPALGEQEFYRVLVKDLEDLELKARIERAADVCYQFLPKDYEKALSVLYRFCEGKEDRLIYMFLSAYVAKYGRQHYRLSIKAIRDFTQYCSSEEGVRAFLEQDLEQTLNIMQQWTRSKNVHIRRLATEGSRPRLPWAKKISILVQKPALTWPILNALKEDKEKYVQKSVANHINDISKDHPDWIVKKVRQWNLKHATTQWIVQHGMRTLIKQGHKGALEIFGNHHKPKARIENVRWDKKVRLKHPWHCSLHVVSQSSQPQSLVIDYKIYFQKKNAEQKPKTFKLKKYSLNPKERLPLNIKYTFKNMTTRQHYPGTHQWGLVINGEAMERFEFTLQN